MDDNLFPSHSQGVPRVVAPLEAGHHVGPTGKEINHFSLAFVTPLGSNYYKSAHSTVPFVYSLKYIRPQRLGSLSLSSPVSVEKSA